LTAINLAISISREVTQTVLLVDTDLRHPTVHKYFHLEVEVGLSDYLLHDIPIPDLLINPGMDKLIILPGGKAIPGSTEILGSPKMAQLVREMKTRYRDRYLVFDCSPLLLSPDSLIFSSYVDGIILVVEAGKTTTDQVKKAMEFLKGRKLLGTVLNKAGHAETYYP
jgi:protein-tyrosine kinase